MESNDLVLSPLGHTWILDLDGTILKHNGYKIDGIDTFLPGAKDFLNQIPEDDLIIFLTSRTDEYKDTTLKFLSDNQVKYHHIIFNAPYGERILVNDDKPSGLTCSISLHDVRDGFRYPNLVIDSQL